jgi:hypothetical protein
MVAVAFFQVKGFLNAKGIAAYGEPDFLRHGDSFNEPPNKETGRRLT